MTKQLKQANSEAESKADSDAKQSAQRLSDDESSARATAIQDAAEKFSADLSKDAFSARVNLVESVFAKWQGNEPFSWADHGQLCVALSDIRARDGLLRRLHDAEELRANVGEHLNREIDRAHEDWLAPLATVFGGITWLDGDAELTRTAVDRALGIDPGYSLAQLLDIALRHNVPASVWSSSLAAVSFDACLKGAA